MGAAGYPRAGDSRAPVGNVAELPWSALDRIVPVLAEWLASYRAGARRNEEIVSRRLIVPLVVSVVVLIACTVPQPDRPRVQTDADYQNDAMFLRSVLAASGDCIKVLDLDANLVYMSEGGQVADVVVAVASLDPVLGGVDR